MSEALKCDSASDDNVAWNDLQTSDFERALESHIASAKPDPLVRRQLEALSIEWINECPSLESQVGGGPFGRFPEPCEARRISGVLAVSGEYVSAKIHASCRWATSRQESSGGNEPIKSGSLHLQLKVAASIIPKTQAKRQHRKEANTDSAEEKEGAAHPEGGGDGSKGKADVKREQRVAAKVRAGMIDRLKKDRLIQNLLESSRTKDESKTRKTGGTRNKNEDGESGPAFLCEAFIFQAATNGGRVTEMEERVDVSEDAMEGLRRAVFSMAEDNLSVLELLLAFPFLPHSSPTSGDGPSQAGKLGHRAALRLLEDAMFDACEKEGEEEIMDDLRISDRVSDDSDSDCSGEMEGRLKCPKKKKIGY